MQAPEFPIFSRPAAGQHKEGHGDAKGLLKQGERIDCLPQAAAADRQAQRLAGVVGDALEQLIQTVMPKAVATDCI